MERKNFKKTPLIALFLSLLVLGGAYAGYHEYAALRQARLIRQARRYLTKSDLVRAQLCLRSALAHDPKDLAACRLMAQLAEASRSPEALGWRRRVVELSPRLLDDRLALALTAAAMRDFSSAASALDEVLPEDKKTAAYQNAAGAVALNSGQLAQAEAHFLAAVRLEPTNAGAQLRLAAVRLYSAGTATMAEARTALQRLASSPGDPAVRCQALRELVVDADRRRQPDAALALSKELLRQPNAIFTDRLLQLDALRETRDAGFKPALAACQREAVRAPHDLYDLASWEMTKISPADALAWLRSLPANIQTNRPAAELTADCAILVGDWRGLQTFLDRQNWSDLEFLRHAYLARALRGQNLTASSKAQWEQAFKLANDRQAVKLFTLLNVAVRWNWPGEGEDILWTIVNEHPDQKWAVGMLARVLLVGGRTRSLMQLYSQEAKRSPSDLAAKNNLAMTALLLDAQELRPLELAREVYQLQPTNPAYASTYALALYLQTNNAEALKVLQQLNPQELQKPSISGCYGLVLQAAGDAAKARKQFDIASGALLLPEERRLIEKAKSGI